MTRSRRIPIRACPFRGRAAFAAALVGLAALAGAGAASSAEVEMPSAPAVPAPSAAPAPRTPGAGSVTAARPVRSAATVARIGASGQLVEDLQGELRRRGIRVAVDGAFGPATRQAVKRIQKRFGLRQTGVADAKLLRRLGLRERRSAGARAGLAPKAGAFVKVFPVAGDHVYSNDWGAPRAQGGHQGTDIMADRHTPVVAADAGTVSKMSRVETGLGGISLWIRRADGIQFYYAHMQSIAAGLEVGSAVAAGRIVGTVGNSGDARYGATHLHFEVRREWTPLNPYPELVGVDPDHASARAQAQPSS